MDLSMKRRCIEINEQLPICKQCELLGLPRSSFYYSSQGYNEQELKIMHAIDKIYTDNPFYGYRKIHYKLLQQNFDIGKDRVLSYMHVMCIEAIYPKKRTTIPNVEHKKYPYLLRNLKIERPNQVWGIDITYIRLQGGFCYMVAIIDWFSRYVLNYKISNTMEVEFCLGVWLETVKIFGKPDICNSDQGSQFTSFDFTNTVEKSGSLVSMNSRGRALDNVIIERWFRSLKYEDIYYFDYQNILEVKTGVKKYIVKYNTERPHQTFNYKTPEMIFFNK